MGTTLFRSALFASLLIVGLTPLAGADTTSALQAFRSGDYATAKQGFEAAAEAGDPAAQYWLGHMYAEGIGVAKDDAVAARWMSKSADAGNIAAMRDLGIMYLNGDGVLQDYALAKEWLEKAAFENDTVAQRNLGTIYAEGLGVPEDKSKAYVWFDFAARGGDEQAVKKRDALAKTMAPQELDNAQAFSETIKSEILNVPSGSN